MRGACATLLLQLLVCVVVQAEEELSVEDADTSSPSTSPPPPPGPGGEGGYGRHGWHGAGDGEAAPRGPGCGLHCLPAVSVVLSRWQRMWCLTQALPTAHSAL
jgi:hypothetical protein